MRNTRATISLLDRLRSCTALRVLALCAAMLASQSVVACAIEEALAQDSVQQVADSVPGDAVPGDETPVDQGCCSLCTDCAHSGCCGVAVDPRSGVGRFALAPIHDTSLRPALTAPASWTPPTLLRPPIDAA